MSDARTNKYLVSGSEAEGEVLPNLLVLTTTEEVAEAEFVGFVQAQEKAIDELSDETVFDLTYFYTLHRNALGHLYTFAGKLRTVNISKGNFAFPPANFLSQAMSGFAEDFLLPLNDIAGDDHQLLLHVVRMHAELFFIHPFREGNGRTVRLFTNVIYLAKTGRELTFEVMEADIEGYIRAVQQAGEKEYSQMEALFLAMALGS